MANNNADLVNVKDPDTDQIGSIPRRDLADALDQGYTEAHPEEVEAFFRAEKYGTGAEQLKTGLEGAASTATFGLSSGLENKLFNNAEEQRQRREENPVSHMTGQVAGLVGSSMLLPGGGAAGLLERAGAGGTEALGLKAAAQGAKLGLKANVARMAVKNAIEGSLVESGNEVSKMFQQDPNQTAQTAAGNVGLSLVLGGVIGGGMGTVSPLWEATAGKKIAKMLGNVADHVEGSSELTALPEDYFQKGMFDNLMEGKKGNAYEIAEAHSRLGIEPTTGTLSDVPLIQNMEAELGKRGTIAGQSIAKEVEGNYKVLRKAGLETFRDATNMTEHQVGREIKDGMIKNLEDRLGPIEKSYEELKPHLKNIQIDETLKSQAAQSILNDELVKGAGNTELGKGISKTANSIAEDLSAIKNLDDLKNYRTLLNKKLTAAYRNGADDTSILQKAKDLLNDIRGQSIENATNVPEETLSKLKSTDTGYAQYKKHLKDFGVESGVGNVNNARQMLDRFSKMSDESFAKRIFDPNDLNQLNFFKQNFPEQFDLARRYKLKEILENSIAEGQGKNGQFDVSKFLNQVSDRKMNPEARDILFAGNAEKIRDIKTVFRSMPGNPNPSGTAAALDNASIFSPKYLLDNVSDAAKYAVLKSLPYLKNAGGDAEQMALLQFMKNTDKGVDPGAFQAMTEFIKNTIKGESNLSKATKEIFKVGPAIITAPAAEKAREKLDEKLKDLQTNNSPLFDVGGKTAHYLPDHGAEISSFAVNAVQYLNAQRPAAEPMAPLDGDFKVDKVQQAKFNTALDIANNPMSVFPDVKNGSITPHQIQTLKTLYPALYSRASQKMVNNMVDAKSKGSPIPYKTKLGLSMFLGQPLDSTMSPSSIQAAQPKAQQMPQNQGPAQPTQGGMKKLGKISQQYQTPLQSRLSQKGQA